MLLTAAKQGDRRTRVRVAKHPDHQFGGMGGIFAVTDAIDNRKQCTLRQTLHNITVSGLFLPWKRLFGNTPLDQRHQRVFHFLIVTTVPCPTSESISNSSTSRRTPGKPN